MKIACSYEYREKLRLHHTFQRDFFSRSQLELRRLELFRARQSIETSTVGERGESFTLPLDIHKCGAARLMQRRKRRDFPLGRGPRSDFNVQRLA